MGWFNNYDTASVDELVGEILTKIENKDNYEMWFHTLDGAIFKMYHEQDCCEDVYLEEIIGDLADLIGSPITMAEEAKEYSNGGYDSITWTFYKFATVSGYVTLRWYGSSNGYYSEEVDFVRVHPVEKGDTFGRVYY